MSSHPASHISHGIDGFFSERSIDLVEDERISHDQNVQHGNNDFSSKVKDTVFSIKLTHPAQVNFAVTRRPMAPRARGDSWINTAMYQHLPNFPYGPTRVDHYKLVLELMKRVRNQELIAQCSIFSKYGAWR